MKLLTSILLLSSIASAQSLTETRTKMIMDAFNAQPDKLIRPLVATDIELGLQDGRVNVNEKAKFSYFLHVNRAADVASPMTLIPMATSRYTPTYYQTDEFWDANKEAMEKARREGTPAPRQDMNEVETWLNEMKLSTNPDVITIDPTTKKVERTPLQNFLYNHYIQNYAKDGYITLFRGAEKIGEYQSWNRGEIPKGVRYWTPTANYAWRYARKNTGFLDEMIRGETPLFKFKIPVADFKNMVLREWPHLTLGTELTKSAHRNFDSYKTFTDDLTNGQAFLGEGRYGVEFELRSNRTGAQSMAKYYKGAITVLDLAADRIQVLQLTQNRLSQQNPEKKSQLESQYQQRIRVVEAEAQIITAIQNKQSAEEIRSLVKNRPSGPSEITNIVGINFNSWVEQKISDFRLTEVKAATTRPVVITCEGLF